MSRNIVDGSTGSRHPVSDHAPLDNECLYCGRKLLAYRWRDTEWGREHGRERGGYGDNTFCGLRCAYSFAMACARSNIRIKR